MKKILSNKKGEKMILLGNDAVVRGALESGVQYVATYPGTPASEVGSTFSQIAKESGVYFEFSVNEKVALESAAGASFCGLKTLVAMKNFGLNVASDFFIPLIYSGVPGPMVVFIADDPSCWSSAQSEQNTRAYASLSHVPILEPSSPQEAKDFTKIAFEISEKFKIPVVVRSTTRVSHQTQPVIFDKNKTGSSFFEKFSKKKKGNFVKNSDNFSTMPPRVLAMKAELFQKIEEIKKISEESKENKVINEVGNSDFGIITSGISYLNTMEALQEINLKIPVLKLGFFHPLPENKIKEFIKGLDKVFIVEELEPYLEKEIKILAKDVNPSLDVIGKPHLPQIGEIRTEQIIIALSDLLEMESPVDFKKHYEDFSKIKKIKRHPQFCQGCPYWPIFTTIKKTAPKGTIFGGEIGCYMLAAYPPHYIQDYLFCMGSSVGIGHGIKKSSDQKLIAFIGDSSFFHSGIPSLINTVYNKSNPLVIILDNRITAMTGHQPNPGMGVTGMGEKTTEIEIEPIVKACGIKNVKTINTREKIADFKKTMSNFLEKKEVSVIIVKNPCIFANKK